MWHKVILSFKSFHNHSKPTSDPKFENVSTFRKVLLSVLNFTAGFYITFSGLVSLKLMAEISTHTLG